LPRRLAARGAPYDQADPGWSARPRVGGIAAHLAIGARTRRLRQGHGAQLAGRSPRSSARLTPPRVGRRRVAGAFIDVMLKSATAEAGPEESAALDRGGGPVEAAHARREAVSFSFFAASPPTRGVARPFRHCLGGRRRGPASGVVWGRRSPASTSDRGRWRSSLRRARHLPDDHHQRPRATWTGGVSSALNTGRSVAGQRQGDRPCRSSRLSLPPAG